MMSFTMRIYLSCVNYLDFLVGLSYYEQWAPHAMP